MIAIHFFSHALDKIGKRFDAPELNTFMKNVRLVVSLSHEGKELFRSNDSEGRNLFDYSDIFWRNDLTHQKKIHNVNIEKLIIIANIIKSNKKCLKLS